jgi:hypothetical protein
MNILRAAAHAVGTIISYTDSAFGGGLVAPL